MQELSENIVSAVKEIKAAIVKAQSRVAANANAEMLSLYFGIGRYVSYRTKTEKWGTSVIDTISAQLQKEMPGLRGFSGKSMRKMRQFYEAWGDSAIWPSATAKLDMDNSSSPSLAVKSGQQEAVCIIWPSATAKLEAANGVAVTVAEFLSISFSYHMEILSGAKTLEERIFYIHEAAQNRWKERQFFNRELNALVAVELKKGAFKPIYLGQLNLYLQALDDTVKKSHENASVGIILCQSADRPYVEYAIRDYNKPLGVATYRTADEMPEALRRALPPIDELRRQLAIAGDAPTESEDA